MADERRRQYVPMDVYIASSPFGVKIQDKWGMEGLCAWMLLLAAAKRAHPQGTFQYNSEADAWSKLGAYATSFTFGDFITYCGRSKQVRKTRSGRMTYIVLTGWGQWNDAWRTQRDTEQKTRKREVSKPDTSRTDTGQAADTYRTEGEAEAESEYEGEAEARNAIVARFGLPISEEVDLELARALRHANDSDAGSLDVLRKEARGLELNRVIKVRESAERRSKRVGVGYLISALRSEHAERNAA